MAAVLRDYGVERPIEIIGTGLAIEPFERGDGNRFREIHGIARDHPVVLRDLQATLGAAGRAYVRDAWSAEVTTRKIGELYRKLWAAET